MRVLLVDDEIVLTFLLRSQLEDHGWEVLGVATNGKAAVELCRERQPDLVLMDIRMPVLDGLEATRRIMAETPTCVIVMTAYGDRDTASQAEAAGAMAYLTKPVSPDDLFAAVGPAQARLRERLGGEPSTGAGA